MINRVIVWRLLGLVLAIGAIQFLLAFSSLGAMPWALPLEAAVIGALILHKRSATLRWLNSTTEPRLRAFLKSFFVYAIPASVLWALFVVGVFQDYLNYTGFIPRPVLGSALAAVGVLALCSTLVGNELSKLGRSPRRMM